MAQRRVVELVDDLDGTVDDSVSTVRFGLDGSELEIELTDRHERELRDLLAPWLAAARRVAGGAGRAATGAATGAAAPAGKAPGRADLAEVRAWVREQGYEIGTRGRIGQAVLAAYDEGDTAALARAMTDQG